MPPYSGRGENRKSHVINKVNREREAVVRITYLLLCDRLALGKCMLFLIAIGTVIRPHGRERCEIAICW
jgi:hypothetical protein